MTASPRIRGSTSFLRSGLRRRIEQVRVQKGAGKVGKDEVQQRRNSTRSMDNVATSQSQSIVKRFPGPPTVIPVPNGRVRKKSRNLQQLPLLLIDLVKRGNPLT